MKTVSKKLLSLLLVAILLVSALPFQAFAEDLEGSSSTGAVEGTDTPALLGNPTEAPTAAPTEAPTEAPTAAPTEAPTAAPTEAPTAAPTEAPTVAPGTPFTLTLNPNGGTINGTTSATVAVTKDSPIGVLPEPKRDGYTFDAWYIDGVRINVGTYYTFDSDKTAVAQWTQNTQNLVVRYVLNGDYSTARDIYNQGVPTGTQLLKFLEQNVASIVQSNLPAGYSWQNNYWRDYSGTQPLTGQDTMMDQAQTVYVNFVSNAYTLYFDPGDGTVTPNSKTVYFNSAVGTLPTPVLSGKVFRGWKDRNGVVYDSNTVYRVASDSTLTAVWDSEALVMLYIYVNGNFASCDRMILMDKYVVNDNISRSDVLKEVTQYYAARPGYSLSIAGLFDENTWASYRANTSKAGVENIGISDKHLNKIFVMVNNAQSGTTILPTNPTTPSVPNNGNAYWVVTGPNTGYWVYGSAPAGAYWVSTGNGTGYWVYNPNNYNTTNPTYYPGTNPKTGDTAQLEVAAAVMILAAAALVTMMALRKKRA